MDDTVRWEDTNTYAAIRQWVRTGTVKADRFAQSHLVV